MNSSRSPRRKFSNAALLVVGLLCSAAAPAFAQQAQSLPAPMPQAVQQQPASDAVDPMAARSVAEPSQVVLPPDASLGEASERVKAMATEADQALDRLIDGALANDGDKTKVGEMGDSNVRIQQLESKLQEAKLVAEYWETVNGKDHRADEKVKALEAEKADMLKELATLREQAFKASAERSVRGRDPDPVVAEITGAAGRISAKILIPYMGETVAHVGDQLPSGHKVVAIAASGVRVVRADGTQAVLGFGTSVPAVRPVSAGAGLPVQVSQ